MIQGRYLGLTMLTVGALTILAGCSRNEEAAAPAPTPAAAPAPAPTPPPAPTAQAGQEVYLAPGQIRRMQFGLQHAGLFNGRVDGVMGPQTESAVSKFQEQNGLPATGRVDQATLDKMREVAGLDISGAGGVRGVPTQ